MFSFLEQRSASKALKTWYFAYFLGQWGKARAPSGYATDSGDITLSFICSESCDSASMKIDYVT